MKNSLILNFRSLIKKYAPFLIGVFWTGVSVVGHLRSRFSIRHLLKEGKSIWLEIGAGGKKGEHGWTTIDMTQQCDIFWDLRKGLLFPNMSVEKIYSSHLFEHLTFKEGQVLLDECLRVLIPGGTFSICVPNARLYLNAYDHAQPLDINKYFVHKPAFNNTTIIDYVNYTAYMDGHHKYMFDEENLIHILRAKGFRNVRLRAFDPLLDMKERDFESIYAEAEKQ
jgi:predicted SAM-dependent methyltransferase